VLYNQLQQTKLLFETLFQNRVAVCDDEGVNEDYDFRFLKIWEGAAEVKDEEDGSKQDYNSAISSSNLIFSFVVSKSFHILKFQAYITKANTKYLIFNFFSKFSGHIIPKILHLFHALTVHS
jgi:hypothetical protein